MENREATKRALELLPQMRDSQWVTAVGQVTAIYTDEAKEAFNIAIAALEKQIPKKPKHIDKNATFDGNWKKVCPACGRVLMERITTPEESYPEIYNHTPHCICGQAIDWEEE